MYMFYHGFISNQVHEVRCGKSFVHIEPYGSCKVVARVQDYHIITAFGRKELVRFRVYSCHAAMASIGPDFLLGTVRSELVKLVVMCVNVIGVKYRQIKR